MPESVPFHLEARRAASRLRASAKDELTHIDHLDIAMDELLRVRDAAVAAGPPDDAGPLWGNNSNAVQAAGAMAVRTGQAIALLVRSGFAIETAGLVRKLGEVAQHAAGVANDPAGDYARNWGHGMGKAGKPSKAYTRGVSDPVAAREKWDALSVQDHANLKPFLNFACWEDTEGRIVFPLLARRHEALDVQAVSSAAWDVMRVAAAVLKVHPHVESARTLELAATLQSAHEDADRQVGRWVADRLRSWGEEPADAPGDAA